MSLRERLLSTVDSFFLAITSSGEINDAFSVDFGSLLNALEEARRTTSLSSEDGKLAFEVAKTIEELVGGIQQLDGVCMELGRELESRAEKELMAGECEGESASNFFAPVVLVLLLPLLRTLLDLS